MLYYRGSFYQHVTAETETAEDAVAMAVADFLFGQGYETETVDVPAGEYITENEMTEAERHRAAEILSQPEAIKEKLVLHFGSLEAAKGELAVTAPLLAEIDTAEFVTLISAISEKVKRGLLDQYLSLAYSTKPW